MTERCEIWGYGQFVCVLKFDSPVPEDHRTQTPNGHTADHGLRPVSTRQWVASVWEYPYLLQVWNTVKDGDEPLIELLHLLSQQEQEPQRRGGGGPATKVKYLPVDPALYDFIFIPICISQGRHWLLASIDVQKREMQLLDCSKEYGGRCAQSMRH